MNAQTHFCKVKSKETFHRAKFDTGDTLKGSELPGIYKLQTYQEKDQNQLIDFGDIDLNHIGFETELSIQ